MWIGLRTHPHQLEIRLIRLIRSCFVGRLKAEMLQYSHRLTFLFQFAAFVYTSVWIY